MIRIRNTHCRQKKLSVRYGPVPPLKNSWKAVHNFVDLGYLAGCRQKKEWQKTIRCKKKSPSPSLKWYNNHSWSKTAKDIAFSRCFNIKSRTIHVYYLKNFELLLLWCRACHRWRRWRQCDVRALCPLKPWWAVLSSRYPSTMHTNYPHTSVSDAPRSPPL